MPYASSIDVMERKYVVFYNYDPLRFSVKNIFAVA